MGFLPFLNRGGRRVVRWPRLVGTWAAVLLASAAGGAAASWGLTGDWWHFAAEGVAVGVAFAAWVTVYGLRRPIGDLPRAA